jgi:cysteine desulfurase
MGFPREWALGSLRMTLGHLTTPEDIATVLDVLPSVVEQQRDASPGEASR